MARRREREKGRRRKRKKKEKKKRISNSLKRLSLSGRLGHQLGSLHLSPVRNCCHHRSTAATRCTDRCRSGLEKTMGAPITNDSQRHYARYILEGTPGVFSAPCHLEQNLQLPQRCSPSKSYISRVPKKKKEPVLRTNLRLCSCHSLPARTTLSTLPCR